MAIASAAVLTPFATDVVDGLTGPGQKTLSPAWLYDDLGSCLFEAITLLDEYGLTRADERLLRVLSAPLASMLPDDIGVAELGSGSGKKTRLLLQAIQERQGAVAYSPIDVSRAALEHCSRAVGDLATVHPICASWTDGLQSLTHRRRGGALLVLFLGSSIGNIDREQIPNFLVSIRRTLCTGDLFLVGADLLKPINTLIAAYDDSLGITAAFNRNLLVRINRELGADFDVPAFAHEARWNADHRRIEMHLVSLREQIVNLRGLGARITFRKGESIWTESSHKFSIEELNAAAVEAGFKPVEQWTDTEWPFAEVLWRAR